MDDLFHQYNSTPDTVQRDTFVRINFPGDKQVNALNAIASTLQSISPNNVCEMWCSNKHILHGQENSISWWCLGDYLLVSSIAHCSNDTIAERTEANYDSIFSIALENNLIHPLRVWNYIPNINDGDGDNENYKRFCLGRKTAFSRYKLVSEAYPAASALGTHNDKLVIFALFGKAPGTHIENPDQVAAYHYPRQYGPEAPSFARATYVAGLQRLYFSGTASVIGHKSVCIDDIEGQTKITIANLERLFAHAEQHLTRTAKFRPELLKVYVRHTGDQSRVAEIINEAFPETDTIYLHADICRSDLLVEVDGHCRVEAP